MRLPFRLGGRGPRRYWPLAPLVVAAVGILAGVAAWLVGAYTLRQTSDAAIQLQAITMADALAARLRATPVDARSELVQRAGSRTGADVLLVDDRGRVIVDATLGAPSEEVRLACLVRGEGELRTAIGRTRFASRPLGPNLAYLDVIVFVPAPETPAEVPDLARAISALTLLFVSVAVAVAWAFARDVRNDIADLAAQIETLAAAGDVPLLPLPIRSIDQVGVLTAAFDALTNRFAAATRASRRDLELASAHDRDRRAFLAAVSHELRTPLHAILGFTEVLLSEVDGPIDDDAREDLGVVRRSALHLSALIDDVLDLSALEWGERSLDLADTEITAIVRDVVHQARATAEAKGVGLYLVSPELLHARVDERRMRQVFANLVGNAVKFTTRGRVDVTLARTGDLMCFEVVDTGPGISTADRGRIFEAFRQAGEARRGRAGTGLGLAIARRLVTMHGGSLDVASEVGRGSTFAVRVPLGAGRTDP